jgi:hypothetical protein
MRAPTVRVYLDNNLFTYLLRHIQGRALRPEIVTEAMALAAILARHDVEPVCSDESLAEIDRHPRAQDRDDLRALYSKLKAGRRVVRNARVTWGDGIARWGSPDFRWGEIGDDGDRKRIGAFLKEKGIGDPNEYDVRYLANALLPQNRIDFFLTYDKKTIWRFREELNARFGIVVKTPSELLSEIGIAGTI